MLNTRQLKQGTSTGVFDVVHEVTGLGVELPILPTLHCWFQHKRGLAHVDTKLELLKTYRDENEDMIQTGIQASPIQALPIIFLGSSYRKRTWIFDPIHLNPCKICFIFSPHLFSHQSPHHRGSSSALACNIPSMNLRPISKPNHCNEDTRAAKLH